MGADGLVNHGEAVSGKGVLAGERGEQHLVAWIQAATAAQRGRDGDVAAGGQGDHVAAGGHNARIGGEGQPVTAG